MVHMTIFEILFTSGETLRLEGADGYQPEGVMTTFFASGSSRSTIDSWSTRIASYRTADVVSVVRTRRDIIDLTVTTLPWLVPGSRLRADRSSRSQPEQSSQ
jgi:hypothetical protein